MLVSSNNDIPVITIDGPSASGKGSLAKLIAQEMGWHLLDSGKLYRILAYNLYKNNNLALESSHIYNIAKYMDIQFVGDQYFLDNIDITTEIHTEQIGKIASNISTIKEVRQGLLEFQLQMRKLPGLVADGRDMGTIIFPDAQIKIYLDADVKIRAQRRFAQLNAMGKQVSLDDILNDLIYRDLQDKNREESPLKPAEDAIYIDASNKSLAELIDITNNIINNRICV